MCRKIAFVTVKFFRWPLSRRCRLCYITMMVFIILALMYSNIWQTLLSKKFWLYGGSLQFQSSKLVKICCIIITAPEYFLSRAKAVNLTWGRRCDTLYFISELEMNDSDTSGLNVPRIPGILKGYDHLSVKSRLGFIHMYKNCWVDHDWFLKADDDTYVIMEHLKDFLKTKNTSEPITYGYNFKVLVPNGYHSGGASYVLSREALKRFYHIHEIPQSPCHEDGPEDVRVAHCLRLVKVYPGESLDAAGKEMFHPYNFSTHFNGLFTYAMHEWAANPMVAVKGCLFHYGQSLFRKFINLGMKTAYQNDEKLRVWFRSSVANPLLPLTEIQQLLQYLYHTKPNEYSDELNLFR